MDESFATRLVAIEAAHDNPSMSIFVTGATGFWGGAIVRRLREEGKTVHALVRDPSSAGAISALGAKVFVGSLADPNEIASAARGCEVVVHAAGIRSPRASAKALRWVHVAGTENVLSAAKHIDARRVVHLSNADVTLFQGTRVHWNEDREIGEAPVGVHAQTMKLAEELALAARDRGLEVIALRPAWVWGPGDRGGVADLAREDGRGGVRLVEEGKSLLAALHIESLAEAVSRAIVARSDVNGRAYYLADADFVDASEFLSALCRAARLHPPRPGRSHKTAYAAAWYREQFRREGLWRRDVLLRGQSARFDVQRAISDLGWTPATTLDTRVGPLENWIANQGGSSAIARAARSPETDADVAAQIALAEHHAPENKVEIQV